MPAALALALLRGASARARLIAHRGSARPHTHPGPVVCYVTEGRILFQVKGHPARYYTAGQTIFEPASTPIERFDNDSSSAPATFIATYLLGDQDTELLHRLQ
ncbi:cupin domain-containing protein [Sorangium sp. So ce1182]|uniref:cupin domain-containing protein n=1 Tax=Sorangium sp. So ce1182 TaxID=3133334 RepID=UPI003F61E4FB